MHIPLSGRFKLAIDTDVYIAVVSDVVGLKLKIISTIPQFIFKMGVKWEVPIGQYKKQER